MRRARVARSASVQGGAVAAVAPATDPARPVRVSALPRRTLTQLVLVEIAAGGAVTGLAARHVAQHAWLAVGLAVAVVFGTLALVPVRRRWLYQLGVSWVGLLRRRSGGGDRLAAGYRVASVTGAGGTEIGVLTSGALWAVPLEIRLDDVWGTDPPVPLATLAGLLAIEDVPLASVRLLTVTVPPLVPAGAPPGPAAPPARAVSRYCVLTLDTMRAADAVAARGGSQTAVAQILRRCVLRAEEVLGNARLGVRPLDEAGVRRALDGCLGEAVPLAAPAADGADGAGNAGNGGNAGNAVPVRESWSAAQVGGLRSTTVAVAGDAARVLARLAGVLPAVPAAVAVTAVVLGRQPRSGEVGGTVLVRLSAPAGDAGGVYRRFTAAARAAGVSVQRLDGEQAGLLRLTTPLGHRASEVA